MEHYLIEGEAAEVLRVSRRTLQLWRQHGTGPPYAKVHRTVRYRMKDIEAYMDAAVAIAMPQGEGSATKAVVDYLCHAPNRKATIAAARGGADALLQHVTNQHLIGIPRRGLPAHLYKHAMAQVNWRDVAKALQEDENVNR